MKNIFITFLLVWFSVPLFSQQSLVKFAYPQLRAGLDNVFYVVTQQDTPVQRNQIEVFFYEMWEKEKLAINQRGTSFMIKPRTYGRINIHIKLKDTTEIHTFHVKPIQAKGLLSSIPSSDTLSFSNSTFRKLPGIMAKAKCNNCCMLCRVISFEAIRISKDYEVE